MLVDHIGPGNVWLNDHVLADVKVWRPSNDFIGSPNIGIQHVYLTGYYAIIAWPRRVNILLNATALAFALDRDRCNAGLSFVIKNNIGAVITDIAVSQMFAGSNYPIGGFTGASSPDV